MIGEVENVELKIRHFRQAHFRQEMALFRQLKRNNSTTPYIKLCKLVDPIITHIVDENQEFLRCF